MPTRSLILASSVAVLSVYALAAPNQWTNPNGGDFALADNWSDGVPTSDDALSLVAGGYEINLDGPASVASLLFDQADVSISGAGPLTISGGLTWSAGRLRGSSLTDFTGIAGNSLISGDVVLDNRTLQHTGTLTFADGAALRLRADANNKGAIFDNAAGAIFSAVGAGVIEGSANTEFQTLPEFRNNGTFQKNGPGELTISGLPFLHSGALQTNGGTTTIADLRSSGSSTINVAAGATLKLMRIQSVGASIISGPGNVTLGFGNVVGSYQVTGITSIGEGSFGSTTNFNTDGSTTFGTLRVINGNIGGSAGLTVTNSLDWRGGIVGTDVSQTFTLGANAVASIPENSSVTVDRRTFQNEGQVTWTGGTTANGSEFRLRNGAIFDNLPGASFTAGGFGTSTTSTGNINGQFNNSGTFTKTGNGTVTELLWGFANLGLVSVQGGTLSLEKVNADAGTWQVANGASLILQRGAASDLYAGTYQLAEGGTVSFRRGRITGSFPTGTGTVELRNDTMVVGDSVPASLVRVAGATLFDPPSGAFTLGSSAVESSGLIDSNGPVNLEGNLALNGGSIGALTTFNFRVTPTATMHSTGFGSFFTANLVNDGNVFIDEGELRLQAGIDNNGAIQLAAGTSLALTGPVTTEGIGAVLGSATTQVRIFQALTNTGSNLALGPATGSWRLENTARIVGGTVNGTVGADGTGFGLIISASSGNNRAILDGTQVHNGILLNENLARVRLLNGANISGVVAIKGSNAVVQVETDVNLDNVEFAINVDNTAPQPGSLVVLGTRTVTLGPNSYFHGANGSINGDFFVSGNPSPTGAATIINQGRISADIAGSTFRLNLIDSFENQGTLEALNGATISVQREFTQTAGMIRLDEGTLSMVAVNGFATTRTVTLAGGRLEGNGTISGNLVVQNATLAPKLGPLLPEVGRLTVNEVGTNAFSLTSDSKIELQLGGMEQGIGYDHIDLNGTASVTLAGELRVSFTGGFESAIQPGDSFAVFTTDVTLAGVFANVVNGRLATFDGLGSFAISTAGNSVVLSDYQGVPEPSAALGSLVGLAALLGCRRRSSRR